LKCPLDQRFVELFLAQAYWPLLGSDPVIDMAFGQRERIA
jgi:hypothetical protein